MKPLQMPNLATLRRPASWLNACGHIDRSACVEVRISEVRRLAGCYKHEFTRRGGAWRKAGETQPLPGEKPAFNRHGRVATGVFAITAPMVDRLHRDRQPRRLAGDWRTPRANAMRRETWQPDPECKGSKGFRCRVHRTDPVVMPFDRGLEGNPNKGASREKKVGLHADWSQPLRIEKWVFEKRIQPAYYLICPGEHLHRGDRGGRGGGRTRRANGRASRNDEPKSLSAHSASSAVNALAPLSTCTAGRKDPKSRTCPQRCLKLLMVQCTPAENRDALAAQLWINSIPPNMVRHYRAEIATLVNRYGPIMEPRVLLCQRCLGTAYGNNPETVRQGWRRRNGKPDTRRETALTQRVEERLASVPPALCTPIAGRIEERSRELLRYRRYNKVRKHRLEMVRSGQWTKFTGVDQSAIKHVPGVDKKRLEAALKPATRKRKGRPKGKGKKKRARKKR